MVHLHVRVSVKSTRRGSHHQGTHAVLVCLTVYEPWMSVCVCCVSCTFHLCIVLSVSVGVCAPVPTLCSKALLRKMKDFLRTWTASEGGDFYHFASVFVFPWCTYEEYLHGSTRVITNEHTLVKQRALSPSPQPPPNPSPCLCVSRRTF